MGYCCVVSLALALALALAKTNVNLTCMCRGFDQEALMAFMWKIGA